MVSLERTDEEKAAERVANMCPPSISSMPDVPVRPHHCADRAGVGEARPGGQPRGGDLVHLFCMAKVTSVSKQDTSDGAKCRVELSIVEMEAEDEDTEEPGHD